MRIFRFKIDPIFIKYYWHAFGIAVLLEIILYQIVFPKEVIKIQYQFGEINRLKFTFNEMTEIDTEIIGYRDWWSYNRSKHMLSNTANEINLHLKLHNSKGQYFLLFETEGNWVENPNWPYQAD